MPDVYKFNEPAVRLAVLQGLLDTEGTVDTRCNSTYLHTVSDRLADDVVFLVQSFGGTVSAASSIRRTPTKASTSGDVPVMFSV